jgi:hypothetical protein
VAQGKDAPETFLDAPGHRISWGEIERRICRTKGFGMKHVLSTLLLAAVAWGAAANCPALPKCPLHGLYGTWVRDNYVDGKRVRYYKCPYGSDNHEFSIVC